MKIIYGPVASWRLGSSLGIDLICSEKKICSFDCIYCQLGKQSGKTTQRKNFIRIDELKKEVIETLDQVSPDVITFSGAGEPTLAKNIDQAYNTIKKITDIPIAIITNSSLFFKLIALEGQPVTQTPHPIHRSRSINVISSIAIAPIGHRSTHVPHIEHSSDSITE